MTMIVDEVITEVMKAEGWDRYTNHPADRGGPTKWGITLKAYRSLVDEYADQRTIQNLTEAEARAFYNRFYVVEPGFDRVHPLVIPLLVDCGVNHGPKRAAKWFQKAVGAKQDGIIGPNTLAAAAEEKAVSIYLLVCAYRFRFFGAIVGRDESQAVFISGWNNRGSKFLVALADLLKEG